MKVSLLSTDFEDIYMKGEDFMMEMSELAGALAGLKRSGGTVKCIKQLFKFKKCKTDLDDVKNYFDDLWHNLGDVLESGVSLIISPFGGSINLFTGDIQASELGGMHFTSFNHLANYTKGPWYTPPPPLSFNWAPKNDHPGYYRPNDVSMDGIFQDEGSLKRGLGFIAADILDSKIDYDQSSAAIRYKKNGSRISKSNYSTNTIRTTEFEPLDNMGTYGFIHALSTGDLTFMARTLHAAGDIAVPFHVLAQGGSEHTKYEDYIHSNWDTHISAWVNQVIIRNYLYNKFVGHGDIDDMLTLCGLETLGVSEGLFTNAGSEKRISIGIACIVAVFHEFYNLAKSKSSSRPLHAYNISIYPYPQSKHPAIGSDNVTWITDNKCNQHAKFISNEERPSTIKREVLVRLRLDQAFIEMPEEFLPIGGSLLVSELESMGWVDMRLGFGFKILYSVPSDDRDETRPGWGYRVKQIACKGHAGYKSPFLPE